MKRKGQTLINQVINNCPKQLKELAPRLIDIIEREKKWISDIIDMRNDVTHYSDLEGFSCFINRSTGQVDHSPRYFILRCLMEKEREHI